MSGLTGSLKKGSIVRVLLPISPKAIVTTPKKVKKTMISRWAEKIEKKVCLREVSYMRGKTKWMDGYSSGGF